MIVKNIFERGIQPGYPTASITGNLVQRAIVQNVDGNAGSAGIFFFNSDGTISNNSLDHAAIKTNWGNSLTVSFNQVKNSISGIECSNTANLQILNNTVDSRINGSTGIFAFNSKTDNVISGNRVFNCSYGISVLGTWYNRTIHVTNNLIDGNTTGIPLTTSIGIYSTTEATGFAPGSTVNVDISGNTTIQNVASGIQVESSNAQRDAIQGTIIGTYPGPFVNNTTITNVQFNNISGNYIELMKQGAMSTITNIDATTNFFDSHGTTQADGFAIEDKILHKMDDPTLSTTAADGLITFIANQLFVTGNQGNTVIQRAMDNAVADGWTAQVKSGPDYSVQNLVVDKSITLDGDGPVAINGLQMNGSGKTLTLNQNLSLASSLDLTDGIVATGVNRLTLQNGASVAGGSDASHVNGYVEKIGNSAFVFPVGNGTSYRPCAITAPTAVSEAFMADYHAASPRATLAPGAINAAGTPALLGVSDKEYWDIQQTAGSSQVNIILTWKDQPTSGGKNSDADLVVASHGPAGWDNLGQASALVSSGLVWVQSAQPATQYAAFALGSTSPLTTLPVHFTYFKASANASQDQIEWGVSGQSTARSFTVWQSGDGVHFNAIGIVPAKGLAYSFMVDHPLQGISYYKVQATDEEQHNFFTPIRSLTRLGNDLQVVCNQQVRFAMQLNGLNANGGVLHIAGLSGSAIASFPVHDSTGPLPVSIQPGMYVFYVTDAGGNIISSRKVFVGSR